MKARTRDSLPRLEWDFASCPPDEVFECRLYEFARETGAIRKDVEALRKGLTPTFEKLVKALCEPISRSARINAIFWYYPEFPTKPFLSIPVNERQRRLRTLWPPASASLVVKPKGVWVDIGQELARGRVLYGSMELALFEINWTESNTFLRDSFFLWLEENRPVDIKPFQRRGAAAPVRRWFDDLKALGAWRWLKNGRRWEDAYTHTLDATGIGLYSNRGEVWTRAAKRAESIIADWERAYAPN